MLCVYIQNCASYQGREHIFRKNHATKCLECEKWSRKAVDGKCDGYMWGAWWDQKNGNVERVLVLKGFLKGSRGARGRQENEQLSGPGRFLMFFDVECFVYIFRIVVPA